MLENNNVSQMTPYYSYYIQRGAPLVFYCEVTIGREGSMFMIFVDRPNSQFYNPSILLQRYEFIQNV